MRIVTVLGTLRPGSLTGTTLGLVHDELRAQSDIVLDPIDPNGLRLAFTGQPSDAQALDALQLRVATADGIILATPEYQGSFAAFLKLVIENLGYPSVLKGKPVGLLGVASGRIGAIKSLEQLRMVCAHLGALVLPQTVSVAEVHTLFDDDGQCKNPYVERFVRSLATDLIRFIRSYRPLSDT